MKAKSLASKRVKIWGNGQITIPLEIRQAYGLTKEVIVRLEPNERYISIIPEINDQEREKTLKSAMQKRKLSLTDLLDSLEEERQVSYENYLKK